MTSRCRILLCVSACSFVCFSLQLNLTSLLAFLHFPDTLVRLTPYFFLGCALSPLVLLLARRLRAEWSLLWLTPAVMTLGGLILPGHPSELLAVGYILAVFAACYSALLSLILQEEFKETYSADLLGAIVGFIAAIFLLPALTGEGIYLLILAASFIPALMLTSGRIRLVAATCLCVAVTLMSAQVFLDVLDLVHLSKHELPERMDDSCHLRLENGAHVMASRWSTIARVDAIVEPRTKNSFLCFDGRIWARLSPLKGGRYTLLQPFYAGAQKALLIGVGGGIDVRDLQIAGIPDIVGVDVNDAAVHLLGHELSSLTADFFPKIQMVLSEGRAFLETSTKKYDLIMLSGADLYSPQFQNMVFLESFLYTREALKSYYDHLTPNGVLIITRAFSLHPGNYLDSLRLVPTFRSFLAEEHLPAKDHFIVLTHGRATSPDRVPRRSVFIVKKTAMSASEKTRLHAALDASDVDWMTEPYTGSPAELSTEKCLRRVVAGLPAPCVSMTADEMINTDNSPFFIFPGKARMIKANYHRIFPLLAALFLIVLYIATSGKSAPKGQECLAALTGLTYGFLYPFFYYHFLIFSRSPFNMYASVQLGALAAAIAACRVQAKISKLGTLTLLVASMTILIFLDLYRNDIEAVLQPTEFGLHCVTLAFVLPVAFSLSLIFPRAVEAVLQASRERRDAEFTFGINLAALSIGVIVSHFMNTVWGLQQSLLVLIGLIAAIVILEVFREATVPAIAANAQEYSP